MRKYNIEQLEVINSNEKHIAVIAGAGSGKTSVLVERIKRLTKTSVKILALTFTRKAAYEMQRRINDLNVDVFTFDSLCYQILNDTNINIVTDNIPFSKKEILSFNLYDVNLKIGKPPNKYLDYVLYKKEHNSYDFNDIEYEVLKVLSKKNIEYDYIFIDEFQDTNELQFKIFKRLLENSNASTIVVGDPDQSIYRFRGANNLLINKYISSLKAKVIVLKTNYRSDIKIINCANNLIKNNNNRYEKSLAGNTKDLGQVEFRFFNTEILEYNYIIDVYEKIKKEFKSYAILFRNHEQGYYYKNYFFNDKSISVLSIHESKGLEFDVVFLIGVNNDVLPSKRENTIFELEEERRLMFVAVTRAKKRIYISSNTRKSEFIKEMKIGKERK